MANTGKCEKRYKKNAERTCDTRHVLFLSDLVFAQARKTENG